MGGHWGTSSSASSGGTVRASRIADALEEWTYATSPSVRDAVAGRLAAAFPSATVRRGDGSTAHDAVVDDVPVIVVHRLGSAFRRDFHALAERFDDVVVYSASPHAARPNEWREFRHRYGGRTAGARIRFVHRRDSRGASGPGPNPVRALATVALSVVAISGLLAASLGLFGADGAELAAAGGSVVASAVGLALGAALVVALAGRRVSIALLKRLPHT